MSKPSANHSPLHSPKPLLAFGVALSILGLGLLVASLWGMSLDRSGDEEARAHNGGAIRPFWIASAACWSGLTMVWLSVRRAPARRPHAARTSLLILTIALASRGIVLATHDATLSDDAHRYVFDGRTLANGHNPYLLPPAARAAEIARGGQERWRGERDVVELLAYPEVTTPYLPLSHFTFAALGWLCEQGGWITPASSARVFRVGFVAFEFAMMLALLALLRWRELSPWWLALYAWHPLAIESVAASGHQDIIGIALMVGGLSALSWSMRGKDVAFAALIGMSMMIKPVGGIGLAMGLRRRNWRVWTVAVVTVLLVCAALAIPLHWRPGHASFAAWKATADWMSEKAAHFGGLYEPVLCAIRHLMPDGPHRAPGFNLEQEWLARKVCMAVLVATLMWVWWQARCVWRSAATGLLVIVLCSTTCHPWYLLWALALLPIAQGGWTLWVYSLTILVGYIVFITGKGQALGVEWTVAPGALAIAYIPLIPSIVADMRARHSAGTHRHADHCNPCRA